MNFKMNSFDQKLAWIAAIHLLAVVTVIISG